MGFLTHYTGTDRIDVTPAGADDGPYWVEIKKFLTGDEFEAAERALATVKIEGTDFTPNPDVTAYQRELVVASIVNWNLTDESDQPLPLEPISAKRKSVGILPQAVKSAILLKINEYNEPRDPQEKSSFRGAADGSAG